MATRGAIAGAVAALADPGRVHVLCLTHQRESFVCVDGAGRPLGPAILWPDGRAYEEIAELGSSRVHELSGKPLDTTPAIYKRASCDKAGRRVDAGAGWVLAAGEGENEPCGLCGHVNERRIVGSAGPIRLTTGRSS